MSSITKVAQPVSDTVKKFHVKRWLRIGPARGALLRHLVSATLGYRWCQMSGAGCRFAGFVSSAAESSRCELLPSFVKRQRRREDSGSWGQSTAAERELALEYAWHQDGRSMGNLALRGPGGLPIPPADSPPWAPAPCSPPSGSRDRRAERMSETLIDREREQLDGPRFT